MRASTWRLAAVLAALGGIMMTATLAHSDEGMWLFNQPPLKILQDRYGFEPTPQWLEHLQKSSVRFNSGGSGSFVSADGLVMTNHHVGADTLQKISTADRDYIKTGFYAKSRADEVKAKDLELNVLMSIEDVTDRVNAAVKPGLSPAEAFAARRKIMAEIEKESLDKTGLRSDVVTLYQGGAYHLYRFKKYTDVRLVFAPEKDIAFFGGDPDNFEYPRYDLDICFFRAYENDKPAKVEHHLTWSKEGCKDGELIFVSGHPGRTSRLNTVQHLEYLRDRSVPWILNYLRRQEVLLKTYSDRSQENAMQAQEDLFGIQNSRKARLGGLGGLQDPALMAQKKKDEATLREAVNRDPKLKEFASAWDDVAKTIETARAVAIDFNLLESGRGLHCEQFGIARTLVRAAAELPKPNAERLREFRDSNLESLKFSLFSEAPIYDNLEIAMLGDALSMTIEMIGADSPLVTQILAGKSPQERAAELVKGSKLKDSAARKRLFEGGQKAIDASEDPMILLARMVDPAARGVRKVYEEKVEEPQRQAYAKIAKATFAVKPNTYPDATFTLRLAFGTVKGYTENGQHVPSMTTIGGTYEHSAKHGGKDPFALPKSWHDAKGKLKLDTPFNFVSTADIIGGNSGSPVVNRNNELVGIIFDGNIQSLVLDYMFTDEVARAVSVHSASIIEALRTVYDATELADELTGSRKTSGR